MNNNGNNEHGPNHPGLSGARKGKVVFGDIPALKHLPDKAASTETLHPLEAQQQAQQNRIPTFHIARDRS